MKLLKNYQLSFIENKWIIKQQVWEWVSFKGKLKDAIKPSLCLGLSQAFFDLLINPNKRRKR